jgi:hypothetical protein
LARLKLDGCAPNRMSVLVDNRSRYRPGLQQSLSGDAPLLLGANFG